MISSCQRHDFIIRKAWALSHFDLQYRFSLIHHYGKVSFATIVATSFMRSITSFAVRQHRFPNANENDICAFGAKWCSSLRSEIRPYGSWSPFPQREGRRMPKSHGRAFTLGFSQNQIRVWVRQLAADKTKRPRTDRSGALGTHTHLKRRFMKTHTL